MDDKKEIKTIETMPEFKPLQVIEWKTGYGCDIKCDNVLIGVVDENWRDQYRAHVQDHFCRYMGRKLSYDYFEKHDDAVRFIRDRWVEFLKVLIAHPIGCICVECEQKQIREHYEKG